METMLTPTALCFTKLGNSGLAGWASELKKKNYFCCKRKNQPFEKGSYSSKPLFSIFIFVHTVYLIHKVHYMFIFAVSNLYIWR